MPRVNPLLLKIPKSRIWDFTFVDPAQPELEFKMKLKPLTGLSFVNSMSLANEFTTKYNDGWGPIKEDGTIDREDPAYVPPTPLPPINDENLVVSENAWRIACGIFVSQVCEEPEDEYSVLDIVYLMARSSSITGKLSEAYSRIQMDSPEEVIPNPNLSMESSLV